MLSYQLADGRVRDQVGCALAGFLNSRPLLDLVDGSAGTCSRQRGVVIVGRADHGPGSAVEAGEASRKAVYPRRRVKETMCNTCSDRRLGGTGGPLIRLPPVPVGRRLDHWIILLVIHAVRIWSGLPPPVYRPNQYRIFTELECYALH